MIGFHLEWAAGALDPALAERFAASLGAGLTRPVGHHVTGGAVLAALCTGPAQARGWRPARLERHGGGYLLFAGCLDDPDGVRQMLGIGPMDMAGLYAAALDRWGDDADLRITGHYAAIGWWPDQRRVRCVRSPIVAPPLHVWQDRHRIIVGSVPRIVFASGAVRPEIDERKIADSLFLNYADGSRGWHKGMARVDTGSTLVLSPDAARTARYHDLAALPRIRRTRDADYVEEASALLREGTRAALRGSTRPAISLSGGLDSAAVAVAAQDGLGQGTPLLGLTAVPDSRWQTFAEADIHGDEWPDVQALAALLPGLAVEPVWSTGHGFDQLETAMFLLAGAAPRNVMNLPWIHALRARARERGCDVLLLGQMGNGTISFGGLGALPSWLARGRWARLARELPHTRDGRSLVRTLLGKAALPLLPDAWARRIERMRGEPELPDWCPAHPDYARSMQLAERARAMGQGWPGRLPPSTRAARAALFGHAANELGDIRQALDLIHGVPSRDPTAYRPLVEFCMGLPDDQFLRDGETRHLARRMLRGRVPETLRLQRRIGVQAADWPVMLADWRHALRAELQQLATDPAMAARFDIPRMCAALDRWQGQGPPDPRDAALLELAIPRALTTARFIRHVSGSNLG